MPQKKVDRRVALAVEKQRLREADEELDLPTDKEIEAQMNALPREEKRITEADLDELMSAPSKEEVEITEEDLARILGDM